MDAANDPSALFYAVSFTVIRSPRIDAGKEEELKRLLTENGAIFIPLRTDDLRVDGLDAHSHIISDHVDFPDYYPALDHNIHVVEPSWVVQSYEKKRQAQTRQHSPDPQMFFKSVVLCTADLPEADKDAITAGVLAMGGLYSSPLTRLVTHLVSLTMDHDKVRLARDRGVRCKVVLPHWFDDCLKLGKFINEAPYLLPDPAILRQNTNGRARTPVHTSVSNLAGATSAVAGNLPSVYQLPSSPSNSRKQLAVFKGKKVLFSRDLNVNEHLAKALRGLVDQAGGQMTDSVDDCDVYIGHYRDGMDYVSASQAGKEVANLAWFYSVINHNRWTNPLSKLLHYPVPRGGIPGFEGMRISVSNYTGDARIYVENLVKEAGAEFTKTMKQDNTHLITAHTASEKCDAAQEWNIAIINALWLEESYAKCQVQSLTHKRYTTFPRCSNLGEIVGQTPVDIDKVRQFYFSRKEKTIRDIEATAGQRNGTTPHPYRGAVPPRPSSRKTLPASTALASSTVPDLPAHPAQSEPAEEPMDDAEPEADAVPEPRTARKKTRQSSDAALHTPAALRRSDEKENHSPPTTGRASKERARDLLNKQKDDIALFQREMKRKGGVMHGGRRTDEEDGPGNAKRVAGKGRKQVSAEAALEDEHMSDAGDVAAPEPAVRQSKKAKSRETSMVDVGIRFTMMVTGDERWLGKAKKEADDKQKLRNLGIALTTEPAECTLLCAPRILRTRKFIAALANAPEVVNTAFLDYCLQKKTLPDMESYKLVDRDAEERLGFRLADARDRGFMNQRRLLRGWTIYVTELVSGGFDTYKEMITINGGVAAVYRGRTGLQMASRRVSPSEDEHAGPESQNQGSDEELDIIYLVSGTNDDEVKLWKTFRSQAEKQGLRARIVKTDWVINVAMSQRIQWDENWLLEEGLVPGWKEKYGGR